MEKKDLEAMLPQIQEKYSQATLEMHRLEGDFRTVQALITNWKIIGEKKGQAVDAQTNPTSS